MERRQRRRRLRVDLGARARARARAACCLLVIAASSGCDEAALAPRDAAPEAADAAAAELAAPPPGDGVVSRIATRAEVPLSPTWAGAREGDWMLRGGGVVAVVSTGKGRLVDFAFEGGDDGIYYVDAAAYDAFDRMHVEVARIEPVGEPARQLHVVLRVLDKPLDLHAW